MLYIVVAGVLGCRKFAAVLSATEYLELNFPYIIVHRTFLKSAEWKVWLKKITEKNGWNHFTLPIVWKECPFRGGKQYLIGGYSTFIKYCSDYFGVNFSVCKESSKISGFRMVYKNMHSKEVSKFTSTLPRYVFIYGSGSNLLPMFLPSLINISGLSTSSGLILGLYDADESKAEAIEGYVEEFFNIVPFQACNSPYVTAHVLKNFENAVRKCDLLLVIIPDFDYSTSTSPKLCIKSIEYSNKIGKTLAFHAKCDIRITIISESQNTPVCLCAAALAEAAVPNVKSQNIIAVTSGIGIMIRSMLAYSLNLPLSYIGSVAVWGFTGVSRIVEPNQMTLPEEILIEDLPAIVKEWITNSNFRIEFLKSYIWPLFGRRMEEMKILLRRNPCLAQVDSLVEVVCHWYSESTSKKETYLGIYSDGTFGIPPGIFFSQPVILINGVWKPNQLHPLPTDPYCKICDLFYTAVCLTDIFCSKNWYTLQFLGYETNIMRDDEKNVEVKSMTSSKTSSEEQTSTLEKSYSIFEILSLEEMSQEDIIPKEQNGGSICEDIIIIEEAELSSENESIKSKSSTEMPVIVEIVDSDEDTVTENQHISNRGSVEIAFSTEDHPFKNLKSLDGVQDDVEVYDVTHTGEQDLQSENEFIKRKSSAKIHIIDEFVHSDDQIATENQPIRYNGSVEIEDVASSPDNHAVKNLESLDGEQNVVEVDDVTHTGEQDLQSENEFIKRKSSAKIHIIDEFVHSDDQIITENQPIRYNSSVEIEDVTSSTSGHVVKNLESLADEQSVVEVDDFTHTGEQDLQSENEFLKRKSSAKIHIIDVFVHSDDQIATENQPIRYNGSVEIEDVASSADDHAVKNLESLDGEQNVVEVDDFTHTGEQDLQSENEFQKRKSSAKIHIIVELVHSDDQIVNENQPISYEDSLKTEDVALSTEDHSFGNLEFKDGEQNVVDIDVTPVGLYDLQFENEFIKRKSTKIPIINEFVHSDGQIVTENQSVIYEGSVEIKEKTSSTYDHAVKNLENLDGEQNFVDDVTCAVEQDLHFENSSTKIPIIDEFVHSDNQIVTENQSIRYKNSVKTTDITFSTGDRSV